MAIKRFYLQRNEDFSGVSGTGIVAKGLEFSDGSVALQWNTIPSSVGLYADIDHVIRIHGHEGRTVIQYTDDEFKIYMISWQEGKVNALSYISNSYLDSK